MSDRKISLSTAVLLNMNIMIGSGILIGPGRSAAISGNASFLAWPLVAFLFLPVVLATVQLSKLLPGAGGFYLYAKEGLGRVAGFTSGWLYVVGYTFAATVEILALRATLLTCWGSNCFTDNATLFSIAVVVGCFLFSLLSVKVISNFLNSLTIVKLMPLAILILLLPFVFNPSFAVSSQELSLLPFSLALPIFGYFGFEYCSSISHLIEDSEKNAPKAILIGFLATATLYTLFHLGLLNVMGAEALARLGAPEFAQFISLPIPYLKALLALLIPTASVLVFVAGTIGMINSNAVLLHSMAEERLFKGSSFLLPVTSLGRPWITLLIQSAVVLALAIMIPSIDLTGNLCILAVFLSFILPFASLIIVRKNRGINSKLPITQWALMTAIGLSIYAWYVLAPTMSQRLSYTGVLLIFVALGFALYDWSRK